MNKEFFNRSSEVVTQEILGKLIFRKIGNKNFFAKIVESEAYFDSNDPSSWARFKGESRKTMEMDPGTILVKMVHNNWLFNIVTDDPGIASAVLIRAVEPLNYDGRGNGPGILTRELKIYKRFNNKDLFKLNEINVIENPIKEDFEIIKDFRVGVKKDLTKKLRFFIKDNKFVSKKQVY